jgi:hypothetical protein
MYAAEQRCACFAETLAPFRPTLELLAQLRSLPAGDFGDDTPESGLIPDDWHLKRMVGTFRVVPGQRWLDLRSLEVHEQLRHESPDLFLNLGYDEFDLSVALNRDRRLTQAIARWAYEHEYQGIIYTSRLDAAFDCWAIVEGAQYELVEMGSFARDDPDLVAIAEVFGLRFSD